MPDQGQRPTEGVKGGDAASGGALAANEATKKLQKKDGCSGTPRREDSENGRDSRYLSWEKKKRVSKSLHLSKFKGGGRRTRTCLKALPNPSKEPTISNRCAERLTERK